jgi:hypothetical protein
MRYPECTVVTVLAMGTSPTFGQRPKPRCKDWSNVAQQNRNRGTRLTYIQARMHVSLAS